MDRLVNKFPVSHHVCQQWCIVIPVKWYFRQQKYLRKWIGSAVLGTQRTYNLFISLHRLSATVHSITDRQTVLCQNIILYTYYDWLKTVVSSAKEVVFFCFHLAFGLLVGFLYEYFLWVFSLTSGREIFVLLNKFWVLLVSMSMSKTFICGAVCREFKSEAPATEEMWRSIQELTPLL